MFTLQLLTSETLQRIPENFSAISQVRGRVAAAFQGEGSVVQEEVAPGRGPEDGGRRAPDQQQTHQDPPLGGSKNPSEPTTRGNS